MLTSTSSSSPTTSSASVVASAQSASQQHHQYLRPEFMSSLPTTLDANKSPLALLAQTCSQIGADVGPTHPKLKSSSSSAGMTVNGYHLPGRTKKDSSSSSVSPVDSKSHHASPSPSSLDKCRALDPGEPEHVSKKAKSPQRDGKHRESPAGIGIDPSDASSDRLTNGMSGGSRMNGGVDGASSPKRSRVDSGASSVTVTSAAAAKKPESPVFSSSSFAAAAAAMDAYKNLQTSFKPSDPSMAAAAAFFPYAFQPPQMATMGGAPSLPSPYGSPDQSWSAASLAALRASMAASSYLSMAYNHRLTKTGESGSVCRDPFCAGCLSAAAAAAAGAPAPPTSPLTASVRPYVCNWINTNDPSGPANGPSYCGKCFASSDELLAHLRTHTSAATAAAEQADLLSAAYAAAAARNQFTSRFHPYASPTSSGLKSPIISTSTTSTSPSLGSSMATAASSLSPNPFYPGLFPSMAPQLSQTTSAASFAHFASMYPHLQPPSLTSLFTGAPRM